MVEAGSGTMWIKRVEISTRASQTASLVSVAVLCGSPGASPDQGTESPTPVRVDNRPGLLAARRISPVLIRRQALTAGGHQTKARPLPPGLAMGKVSA